jgi:hypothetical protein
LKNPPVRVKSKRELTFGRGTLSRRAGIVAWNEQGQLAEMGCPGHLQRQIETIEAQGFSFVDYQRIADQLSRHNISAASFKTMADGRSIIGAP